MAGLSSVGNARAKVSRSRWPHPRTKSSVTATPASHSAANLGAILRLPRHLPRGLPPASNPRRLLLLHGPRGRSIRCGSHRVQNAQLHDAPLLPKDTSHLGLVACGLRPLDARLVKYRVRKIPSENLLVLQMLLQRK